MRRLAEIGGLTIAILLLAATVTVTPAIAGPKDRPEGKRYIVKVKKGFSPEELAKQHEIPTRNFYKHALNGLSTAKIPPGKKDEIESDPRVAYVEVDQRVHALGETLPWGVDRINAERVWGGSEDSTTVTGNAGSGVQVAVIDTGIDYTHPDLKSNYRDGYDFVNDDDDPKDTNGHGTHVSGTIAAVSNTEGVIGVAPEVELYALKALDKQGSGYLSDVAAGIEWAIVGPDGTDDTPDDAEIVSMSLGASSGSDTLKTAVKNAYQSGTLPVAAAGNSGDGSTTTDEYSYPAAYESVIAVGATDKNNEIASFSNTGPYLELAAPGVDILSTMPTYRVHMNGRYKMSQDYDTMSGTSMACPHVSGTAALVFAGGVSDSDGDGNTADDVRNILDSSAKDLGPEGRDSGYGYGLVDAEVAVDSLSTGDPPTISWTEPTNGEVVEDKENIRLEASDTETAVTELRVEWNIDGEAWKNTEYDSNNDWFENIWDTTSFSEGDHTLNARVTDGDGNTSTTSITVNVQNSDDPPKVSWINPSDGETVNNNIAIKIDASDDLTEDNNLTVKWTVENSTWTSDWRTATYNPETGYYENIWDTSQVSDNNYTLTAKAIDGSSNYSLKDISVTVNNEAGGMYVWDIGWKEAGPHIKVTVTIQVDSDGDGKAESSDDPVSNAEVDFQLSNTDTGKSWGWTNAATDDKGEVGFMLKNAPSGTYSGEVTGLTHSNYEWNSSLDYDNPDSYTK